MKTTFSQYLIENTGAFLTDYMAILNKLQEMDDAFDDTMLVSVDDDGGAVIHGNLEIHRYRMKKLPVKIKEITGDLIMVDCHLVSLEGCPETVNGDFDVNHNKLRSLKNGPKRVTGACDVSDNSLQTLEGAPEYVGGNFDARDCGLESLSGGPIEVYGDYNASNNHLESVEHCAKKMSGWTFDFSSNNIASLVGVSEHVNPEGTGSSFFTIDFSSNPIKEGGLGLLQIKHLKNFEVSHSHFDSKAEKIIKKYLHDSKLEGEIFECQEELINAGLEEYAQL